MVASFLGLEVARARAWARGECSFLQTTMPPLWTSRRPRGCAAPLPSPRSGGSASTTAPGHGYQCFNTSASGSAPDRQDALAQDERGCQGPEGASSSQSRATAW
eukprot:3061247-Pyramimonas_sp.AAC.1